MDTEIFFKRLLSFFPKKQKKYCESIIEYGKRLDTVVIEDIFMPEIISLLEKDTPKNLINDLFDFFEQVTKSSDEYLVNIFSITVLESLGNDKEILKKAQKYMGTNTKIMQIEADQSLGRFK